MKRKGKEDNPTRPFLSAAMPIARRLPPLTGIDARASIGLELVDERPDERTKERMPPGQSGLPDFSREVLVYEQQLRARARRLCTSDADAEDLVQATFERALKHYHQLEPGSNIRGWLMTILGRLAIDLTRHRKISREVPIDLHEIPFEPPSPPSHPSIEWDDVVALLPQLPSHLRHVIELRAQKLSYIEIGQRLGMPTNTVATRIRRAIEEIRKKLGLAPEAKDEE